MEEMETSSANQSADVRMGEFAIHHRTLHNVNVLRDGSEMFVQIDASQDFMVRIACKCANVLMEQNVIISLVSFCQM